MLIAVVWPVDFRYERVNVIIASFLLAIPVINRYFSSTLRLLNQDSSSSNGASSLDPKGTFKYLPEIFLSYSEN